MKDEFETFIKNKLEEGVAPSLSSLSAIKHAAKENSAARRISHRIKFIFSGLLAAALAIIIALTVLFKFEVVDSREITRASQSNSISRFNNVTMEIIGLLSINDVENQDFAQISPDIDRLLLLQDAPYNEIVYEYSNQL
mgnify:FL=1